MVQIATKEGPRRIPRSEEREWRMSITQNGGVLSKTRVEGGVVQRVEDNEWDRVWLRFLWS